MVFIFLTGIIFIIIAVFFAVKELLFHLKLKSGALQSIQAVCKDYSEEYQTTENGDFVAHYPVYEYRTEGGIKKYKSNINGRRHNIGDEVVLYQNTKTGEIKDNMSRVNTYIAVGCGSAGLILLLTALLRFFGT